MDAFDIRMQFLNVLRKLSSSQQSIQRVVAFAVRYGEKFGDELWDCLLEECERGSLNTRINVFYALDSLLEASINAGISLYSTSLNKDLPRIVDLVVPDTREGILNLMSAKQIISAWRQKRLLDQNLLEKVETKLNSVHVNQSGQQETDGFESFTQGDIMRRIEDDRERHKRLREGIWVLPVPNVVDSVSRLAITMPSPRQEEEAATNTTTNSAAKVSPADDGKQQQQNINLNNIPSASLALDVEFEQQWEQSLNEDLSPEDFASMQHENEQYLAHKSI